MILPTGGAVQRQRDMMGDNAEEALMPSYMEARGASKQSPTRCAICHLADRRPLKFLEDGSNQNMLLRMVAEARY